MEVLRRCSQGPDSNLTCPYREGINGEMNSAVDRIEIVVSQQDEGDDRHTEHAGCRPWRQSQVL
jgi:hypothetical protein